MTLDDKLREIIGIVDEAAPGYSCCEGCGKDVDKAIAQIHKAFADEFPDIYMTKMLDSYQPVMTGAYWYDRFVKELGEPKTFVGYAYDDTGYEDDDVLEAAKRAAGLDDNNPVDN